jgi:CubicO group peptidase (beta-lactamase class C family)
MTELQLLQSTLDTRAAALAPSSHRGDPSDNGRYSTGRLRHCRLTRVKMRCLGMLMMTNLALVVAQASASGAGAASTPPLITSQEAQKIDALFAQWSKPDTPGCALGVVKDGATIYQHNYGLADVEHLVPITRSTVFHVASVSKQFTAFAIFLLAKEGRLSLDDDIRKYLPELHDFGTPITIRHFLHHTSGLRDQWELLTESSWREDDVTTQQDVLNMVWRQRQLNFAPGDQFLYSNTGYTLLGLIVERVSGMSLRQFTDERMFKPLGMEHTHFHEHYGDLVRNRAYSYDRQPDGSYSYVALSYSTVGPSSLFTTVGDLARWDENFYSGRIGGKDLLAQMQQKGRLNSGKDIDYASGLEIGQYRGLQTVYHNGGDAGYRAEILRFPEAHLSVISLCNASGHTGLAYKVSDILLSSRMQPVSPKAEPTEVTIDPALLEAYVGDYQLPGFSILRISREGNQLTAQWRGVQGKDLFFPSSETKFFSKASHIELTFDRPAGADKAKGVTLHRGGDQYGKRISIVQPTPEQLRAYSGTYYSDELDTLYTVSVQAGKLHVRLPKEDSEMAAGSKDVFWIRFDGNRVEVQFHCASPRSCDIFQISNADGGVQNLLFRRIDLPSRELESH